MPKKFLSSGVTLIEIIVAIAILSILFISFLLLFTESFANIFSAGNKSEALFTVQSKLENKIDEPSPQGESHTLEIIFPNVLTPIRVDGKIVTIYEPYYRGDSIKNVELKVFIP